MDVSLETIGNGDKYRDAVHRMGRIIFYRYIFLIITIFHDSKIIFKFQSHRMMNPWIKDWMLPFMPKLRKETTEVVATLESFTDKLSYFKCIK